MQRKRNAKGTAPTAPKVDVYEEVTRRILEELDSGVVPWHKPWTAVDGDMHRNLASGKPYRGVNQLLLSLSGFQSSWWVTFKQAADRGGSVRKGEKSTLVVFWKMFKVDAPDEPRGFKTIPMLRYYRVFNADQCDGLNLPTRDVAPFDPIERAEIVWDGWSGQELPVTYGGDSAAYVPAADCIRMPLRESFESSTAFYSVAFHESTHSTGHASRLNRPGVVNFDQFGSHQYAAEELVAEMGSAMLMARCGLFEDVVKPSAAYIANWRQKIGEDPKLIVHAAGKAQRAADMILGEGFAEEEDVPAAAPVAAAPAAPVAPVPAAPVPVLAVQTEMVFA